MESKVVEDQQQCVEELLDNDAIFQDFYNAFLDLPIFPVKLIYDPALQAFQYANQPRIPDRIEGSYSIYKTQVLAKSDTLAWTGQHRLSFFLSSAYYLYYRFTKALQREACGFFLDKKRMDSFIKFLKNTAGGRTLSFWIDAEKIQVTKTSVLKASLLKKVASDYLSVEADYDLKVELEMAAGLKLSSLCESKVIEAQDVMLTSLRQYWIPRFLRQKSHTTLAFTKSTARPQTVHGYPVKDDDVDETSVHKRCSTVPVLCNDGKPQRRGVAHDLVNALDFEDSKSSNYFQSFLERKRNQVWINSLMCWTRVKQLQAHSSKFFCSNATLLPKAKLLLNRFLAKDSRFHIGCRERKAKKIESLLSQTTLSSFLELVDQLQDLIIENLLPAWQQLYYEEIESLKQVPVKEIEIRKSLSAAEVSSTPVVLQKQSNEGSLAVSTLASQLEIDDDDIEPMYCERLRAPVFTFDRLIHNCVELDFFKLFLNERYAARDLTLWMDVEELLGMAPNEKELRNAKVQQIKTKYLHKRYFFGQESPAPQHIQKLVTEDNISLGGKGPSYSALLEIQQCVRDRLEKRWLPMFVASEEFQIRQNPKHSSIVEVVQAILTQRRWEKRQREAAAQPWKILKKKWVTSSKDVVSFRKALRSPVTCMQFKNYVSLKNDGNLLLENNITFWIEVQKYQELFHGRCDLSTIKKKAKAIVNRFLTSAVPPRLQITIPLEMAEEIACTCKSDGPGLHAFRQAQEVIFHILYSSWLSFCKWKSRCMTTGLPYHKLEKEEKTERERSASVMSNASRLSELLKWDSKSDATDSDDEMESTHSCYTFRLSVYEQTGQLLMKKKTKEKQVMQVDSESERKGFRLIKREKAEGKTFRTHSVALPGRPLLKVNLGKRSASLAVPLTKLK